MKKAITMFTVVCWGVFTLEAKVSVTACCGDFASNPDSSVFFPASSENPLLFKVTNNGGAKTKLDVTIFKKKNDGVESADDESFNVIGNGVYIAPNNSEEIKLRPYLEDNDDAQEFTVVFKDSNGNKTIIPLKAIPSRRKQIILDRIEKGENGLLKAVTQSSKTNQ